MALEAGLRERKKRQTRQEIFEASQRLFRRHGFDAVTVASIARAADVSEVTVFNYFPTKEDLFYAGMEFFEERLVDAVRNRPRGESALEAFRRCVLEGAENLVPRERTDAIRRSGAIIAASPSLRAREWEIVDRHTRRLAEVLGAETGARADEVEPAAVASMMMATHRALVAYVRARVAAGRRGADLVRDFRGQARRAFARLERGLGDYAVRP